MLSSENFDIESLRLIVLDCVYKAHVTNSDDEKVLQRFVDFFLTEDIFAVDM